MWYKCNTTCQSAYESGLRGAKDSCLISGEVRPAHKLDEQLTKDCFHSKACLSVQQLIVKLEKMTHLLGDQSTTSHCKLLYIEFVLLNAKVWLVLNKILQKGIRYTNFSRLTCNMHEIVCIQLYILIIIYISIF